MALPPELERALELAERREQRHMEDMRVAVIRHYRKLSVRALATELRRALDAPNTAESRRRTDALLTAFDHAVRELRLPPTRAEQIIRQAVRGRVQSLDEVLRLQNPALSFNDPAEVQARAVSVAREQMNVYWAREQKRFRDGVAKTIRQAIRQGMSHEQAARLLEQRLGVSRSRAILIVTDQCLTAAAHAERARQRDMGIERYTWRTVGDKRVRAEHRARNGQVYAWKDGGEYPGQAIRCRCRALPVLGGSKPKAGVEISQMTDQLPERFPRTDLASHPEIPNELLLRVDSPEALLREARRAVLEEGLAGRRLGDMYTYPSATEFREAIQQAFIKEMHFYGASRPRSSRVLPRGWSSFAEGGKMYFSDKWYADAASNDLLRRADALHTAFHEAFHSVRRSPATHVPPLEEGMADLFAEYMCIKHLGTPLRDMARYLEEREQVRLLALRLGKGDFEMGWQGLVRSRNAQNLKKWLWEHCLEKGLSPVETRKMLGYTYDGAE